MLNSKAWRGAVILLIAAAFAIQGSYIIGPPGFGPIFPSTGTPSFIQAAEAHTAGTPSTLSVSFGSLPAVANIAIVGTLTGATGASDQTAIITDNQGNSYARLTIQPNNNGSVSRDTLWCTVVTASAGTFTATVNFSAAAVPGLFALEYAGTTCNPDKLTGDSTSLTSPYSCGSATTSNAHDLLITMLNTGGSIGAITFTAPTGFTIRTSQGASASGRTGAIADEIVSATASYTPTFSASQNIPTAPCAFIALLSK